MGAIASSLEEVSLRGVGYETISSIREMSEEEQAAFKKIVTIDAPEWIATLKGRPAQEAASVYSCNAKEEFGCWKAKDRTFTQMKLENSQLQTINIFKLKEDLEMAGLNLGDMKAFDEDLGVKTAPGGAPAPAPAPAAGDDKPSKSDAKSKMLDAIRSDIRAVHTIDATAAMIANLEKGRLMCFVTSTDNVVKLKSSKVAKKDANGNVVLKADHGLTDEQLKKAKENNKYPLKACETLTSFGFAEAKPGKILGVVINTPVGSEVSLERMHSEGTATIDESNTDMVSHVMSTEVAFQFIALNYGGKINESEDVLGGRAGRVVLQHTVKEETKESGETQTIVRTSFKLEKSDKQKRKSLLVEGNFFPVKVYKTIDVSKASEDEKKILNLNIEAALKKEGAYENLCDESRASIEGSAATGYTSAWFNKGTPISAPRFDKIEESDVVTDVRVPSRKKTPSKKDPNNFIYSFEYANMGDPNGPDNIDKYKSILDACVNGLAGNTVTAFVKEEEYNKLLEGIKKLTKKNGSSRSNSNNLSNEDFLKLNSSSVSSQYKMVNSISLAEAAEQLKGLD